MLSVRRQTCPRAKRNISIRPASAGGTPLLNVSASAIHLRMVSADQQTHRPFCSLSSPIHYHQSSELRKTKSKPMRTISKSSILGNFPDGMINKCSLHFLSPFPSDLPPAAISVKGLIPFSLKVNWLSLPFPFEVLFARMSCEE